MSVDPTQIAPPAPEVPPPAETVTIPSLPAVTADDVAAVERRLQTYVDGVLRQQPTLASMMDATIAQVTPAMRASVADAVNNRMGQLETQLRDALDSLPAMAHAALATAPLSAPVADTLARHGQALETLAANHADTVAALAATQQAIASVAPATAAAVASTIQQDVLAQLEKSPQASANTWKTVWALGLIVTMAVGYLLVESVSLNNATAKAWLPWVVGAMLTASGLGGAFMARSPLQR